MLAWAALRTSARVARFVGLFALIACGALVAGSPPAAAQLVDRSVEHVQGTSEEVLCGLPVITTFDFVIVEQERIGPSGFPQFMLVRNGKVTWTNPETGKSASGQYAGIIKDLSVTDNGNGTITVRWTVTGLAQFIRSNGGQPLVIDVGRVVFATVLDYNGTPTDVEDDEFVSETVESISGPHPDFESDFTLGCDTLLAALT